MPTHVVTPLLSRITAESLDQDYLEVAQRRPAGQTGGSSRPSHWVAAAVIAVFGVLVAVAAVQTSRNAGAEDAGRATLVDEVNRERDAVAAQQERIADLQAGNIGLEDQVDGVTAEAQLATARLQRLQVRTGFVAVTGPGVRITVADAPNGDATQVVRDEDLALLVDGLWNAGAEAISVNGQRLTVLSSIRNVGPAIHVNSRPLIPPYTVLALGDTRTLQANLLESTHGRQFYDLADQLGFGYSVENEDVLELPAARNRRLSHATASAQPDKVIAP